MLQGFHSFEISSSLKDFEIKWKQKQDNKAQPVLSEKHSAYVTYNTTLSETISFTLLTFKENK